MIDLVQTAIELLNINRDITQRLHSKSALDNYEMKCFEQTWATTSGGFDDGVGFSGQSFISQRTYVFIPKNCDMECYVYFGSRYAYSVPFTQKFADDVLSMQMKPLSEVCYYKGGG